MSQQLVVHLLLLGLVSAAVVLMGAFHSEAEDGPALRSYPRRLGVFLLSCAAVALVMLVCEHLFAGVD